MRLKEKSRIGSKVKRIYDKPLSPFVRVLLHPAVSDDAKKKLKLIYQTLNPAQLKRDLIKLQNRLFFIAESKSKHKSLNHKSLAPLPYDKHSSYISNGSHSKPFHIDI